VPRGDGNAIADVSALQASERRQASERWSFCYSPEIFAGIAAAIDFVAVLAVGCLAYALALPFNQKFYPEYFAVCIVSATVTVLTLAFLRLYRCELLPSPFKQFKKIAAASLLVCVLAYLELTQVAPRQTYSPLWYWEFCCLLAVALLSAHYGLYRLARVLAAHGVISRNVAIVGCGEQGARILGGLLRVDQPWTRIVGVFDDRNSRVPLQIGGYPWRGTTHALVQFAESVRVDDVFIALPRAAEHRIAEILHSLRGLSANVQLVPDLGDGAYSQKSHIWHDRIPAVGLLAKPLAGWSGVAKILEDYAIASAALLALLPLMGLIALAIKFESPGPVIFKQRRTGWNNRDFHVYKFRTMAHAAHSPDILVQTAVNDPRVTNVGRFLRRTSLDELPQLLNVLTGTMSIVGPRPHATNMRTEDRPCREIVEEYAHRHRVKPGITGWAQVNGFRGAADTEQHLRGRVALDLFYIEHWSLFLDFKILLLTCVAIISQRNAF
jgi:Undecaprenyl-phosphate glucose phosphotransferase